MPLAKSLPGSNPPMVITVQPVDRKSNGHLLIEVREKDASGTLRTNTKADLSSATSRARLLTTINSVPGVVPVVDAYLIQLLVDYRAWREPPADVGPFILSLHKVNESDVLGTKVEIALPVEPAAVKTAFRGAIDDLAVGAPNMVLSWNAKHADKLCVVDVDYHGQEAPTEDFICALAGAIRPRPLAWWRSHGGGLHLVFVAVPPYDANELAACAALTVSGIDPTATVEILTSTRHPRSDRIA